MFFKILKIKEVRFLLLLLCSSFVTSSYLCADQVKNFENFELRGEWLYMLPAIDNPYFVMVKSPSADFLPIGEGIANNQDWHSGFRLAGKYRFCTLFTLEARWTSFDFSNKKEVSGPALGMLLIGPEFDTLDIFSGSVRMRDTIDFDTVEVLVGLPPFFCCNLGVNPQIGLQYTYLQLKENEDIFIQSGGAPNSFVNNAYNSRMWGIGPELIFDFSHPLFFPCLNLTGRLGGTLLVSKTKTKAFAFGNVELLTTDANYEELCWRIVPATNLRLGCDYKKRFCICDALFNLKIEMGYEFILYNRPLFRIRFTDDVLRTLAINEYTDFSLHGPYVAFSATF